ncbi:Fur family transcriptional regulator [Thiocystis violacea]|uniref:Fur family transcriptional regulator n=1 Tax=Thiocystis violacea TaxID=13725 RepID=UPI0019052FAE|nr:Fur family transcriptional regulator [Thiocystis violacea]MBK1721019.1 transcriptional repressor [Thiocystis violacea]
MDGNPLDLVLRRADALCRERGARLTPQRRQVLKILCAAGRPLGAYEILEAMREGARALAPPTVYRALDFLLAQGLVHKLESLHAFVGCNHPERPHCSQFLICADCGLVTELEDAAIARSLKSAAKESGFRPERRVVELIGTCADCAHKRH